MAGTGHAYEISNPAEAMMFVDALAERAKPLDRAVEWIRSPHFLKFITSKGFTVPFRPISTVGDGVAVVDPYAVKAMRSGREVRAFSAPCLSEYGPDFDHLLDFAGDLARNDPRAYAKLPRMSVPSVEARAREWTRRLGKLATEADATGPSVLTYEDEFAWFELTTVESLRREGRLMSHCVGSDAYAEAVALGATRIFSLRGPAGPVATVELRSDFPDRLDLRQAQGKSNTVPSPATSNRIADLLNLLAADDGYAMAGRVNLTRGADGRWDSLFNAWSAGSFHGHATLTDGRHRLYLSSDGVTPLLLTAPRPDREGLCEGEPPLMVTAGSDTPHYDDQRAACAILEAIGLADESRRHIAWIGERGGRLVPLVDTWEEEEYGGIACFVLRTRSRPYPGDRLLCDFERETRTVLVPHGADRARILMTLSPDSTSSQDRDDVRVHERVSRVEAERCLAVMTALGIQSLRGGEQPCDWFRSAHSPHFCHYRSRWFAFAHDAKETPATLTPGRWRVAEYKLTYDRGGASGSFSVSPTGEVSGHAYMIAKDDAREIVRMLNGLRLTARSVIGTSASEALCLYPVNGRWHALPAKRDLARHLERVVLEAERRPTRECLPGLEKLLTLANAAILSGNRSKRLPELRLRGLKAWLRCGPDFTAVAISAARVSFSSDARPYSLVQRLCDLHDGGYRPEGRKEGAAFKRAIAACASLFRSGGAGSYFDPEYSMLALRFHPWLTKGFLNRSPWRLSMDSLHGKYDVPAHLRALIEDKGIKSARFRDALIETAQGWLKQVGRPETATDDEVEARLLLARATISRWRWMSPDFIETVSALLGSARSRESAEINHLQTIIRELDAEIARRLRSGS